MTWEHARLQHQDHEDRQGHIKVVKGREGSVTCRFTLVYPDGPASISPSV